MTPPRFSVRLADENIFAVKGFQPRTIRVLVWANIAVGVGLNIVGPFMLVSSPTRLLFFLLFQPPYRSLSEEHNARIILNDQKQPDISQQHQGKGDEVEDEDCDRSVGLLPPIEKMIHCDSVPVSEISSTSSLSPDL